MIKEIKYNRMIQEFEKLLSTVSDTSIFMGRCTYYYNDEYPSADETLFYSDSERKVFYIDFVKMEEFGITFGLDYITVKKLICEQFNKMNYKVYKIIKFNIC